MITTTSPSLQVPTDKRAFGKAVGDELLKRHGKKRAYSQREIANAVADLGFNGLDLWAEALYGTAENFRAVATAQGTVADYAQMKADMFAAMTDGASASWFDLDMSWLEWPDINFGDLFSFFDF